MKKTTKLFLVMALLLQFPLLRGQGLHISVESLMGFPTQVYYNQVYAYDVYLHNYDSTDFQGYLNLHYRTDNMLNSDSLYMGSGPFQVFIPADSFSTISITDFSFDTAAFKLGGNVVVVWPVASSGMAIYLTDTFYTNVEILGYAGIEDLVPAGYGNIIYPNPANQVIFLSGNRSENSVEYVRIIDVTGRILETFYTNPGTISTAKFENGMYMIELKEKNKIPEIMKFIISR